MRKKQFLPAQAIARLIEENNIKSVLVGVSGGADSCALLRGLTELQRFGLRVVAVHCNFHLRGEESNRDEKFVEDLCRELNIDLKIVHFDVSEYIKENGGSVEMACRDLRYAEFRRLKSLYEIDRIAIAHNKDDNVETFLLNLMRGSGSRGLKGMEVDNGEIFRPLLGVSRKEIESYLQEIGQDYIVDSTNLESDYNRNFLRNEVLPLLRTRWPEVSDCIAHTQSILREENRIVERKLSRGDTCSSDCVAPENKCFLSREDEGVLTAPVSAFLRFIEPFGGSAADAAEIAATACRPYAGRIRILSEQYEIEEEREGWRISQSRASSNVLNPADGWRWEKVELSPEVWRTIRSDRSNNVFWTSCPPENYSLRTVKRGDRMEGLGMKGSSLLSDIMKDAHLSRQQKMEVVVAVRRSDGRIVWASGLRRSPLDLIAPDAHSAYRLTPDNG